MSGLLADTQMCVSAKLFAWRRRPRDNSTDYKRQKILDDFRGHAIFKERTGNGHEISYDCYNSRLQSLLYVSSLYTSISTFIHRQASNIFSEESAFPFLSLYYQTNRRDLLLAS